MRLAVHHSRRAALQALQIAARSELSSGVYSFQSHSAHLSFKCSCKPLLLREAGSPACYTVDIRLRGRSTRSYLVARAAKGYKLHMATATDESRVRSCVISALKLHFALSSDKQWVSDFIAESIVVELITFSDTSSESTTNANDTNNTSSAPVKGKTKTGRAPGGDGKQPSEAPASYFVASSLPQSAEEAQESWGSLVFENLDDVENQDVKDFCEQLLNALQQLAEQIEEEQGSGSAGSEDEEEGACEMCGRVMPLTKHHLIPRDVHKEWKKKGATFDDLQAGAMICRSCHNAVHRVADNKTLAQHYNTVEKLMQVPSIQKHVVWAAKQKVVARSQNLPAKFRHRH